MTVLDRLRAAAARRPHADIAIAAVIYTVTLVTTAAGPAGDTIDAHGLTLATLTCGALAARTWQPFAVLLITTVGAEAYLLHYGGHHGQMVLAAPLIALYTVAETSSRRRSLIIGGLVVLTFGAVHLLIRPSWLGAENVALGALGALAVAAGTASRHRRAWLAEAQARAAQAEADREAEAARRVTEERLRIARELHDVLGHHLALIHVQAGVAAHVLDTAPAAPVPPAQRAREALTHIADASKTALAELADTVGLLRHAGDHPPTTPTSGLDSLTDLLHAFRSFGLTITEHTDGTPRPVPTTVGLTAYRIVQESLTNVCKHAGAAAVTLWLEYQTDSLAVTVDNQPGPTSATAGTAAGHGLTGMRERVTALGGMFDAGRRPHGGYRVSATLPLTTAGIP